MPEGMNAERSAAMATRMPALFFGHGNPMNALLRNPYTEAWGGIGTRLPRPKAILCVSAHWYIQDAAVTVSTAPRTIHDFGGFPRELYHPAPSARRALPATAQGVFAREPLGQDRPARGIAPGRNMEVIVLSQADTWVSRWTI